VGGRAGPAESPGSSAVVEGGGNGARGTVDGELGSGVRVGWGIEDC